MAKNKQVMTTLRKMNIYLKTEAKVRLKLLEQH